VRREVSLQSPSFHAPEEIMTPGTHRADQRHEVEAQVAALLARSAGFNALSERERALIKANTTEVVDTMVQNRLAQAQSAMPSAPSVDPFAVSLDDPKLPRLPGQISGQLPGPPGTTPPKFTGGATQRRDDNIGPKKAGDFGSGIAMGVQQTGELLREINFPAFVAELVQGVFQAVIDASIQQMRAYGELVQSVTMSLNEFRDQNVTQNQARDHLGSKYPTLMQVNITDQGPRMGLRPGADESDLPNFKQELGLDEDISSLDDETIEQKLVPAARNDLARSRQSLLATMLLIGINRIVVTDGKINAKLRFDFHARDTMQRHAQDYDYQNLGTTTVEQSTHESGETTGQNFQETQSGWVGGSRSGESNRWTKGADQRTTTPVIVLKRQEDLVTQAEISAEGQLRSEVSLNFKSETFDLNKIASADEVFKLERVRTAGRAAAAPGATTPGATPAGGTGAPTPRPAGAQAPPAAPVPAP
jgi:hypothetical protein